MASSFIPHIQLILANGKSLKIKSSYIVICKWKLLYTDHLNVLILLTMSFRRNILFSSTHPFLQIQDSSTFFTNMLLRYMIHSILYKPFTVQLSPIYVQESLPLPKSSLLPSHPLCNNNKGNSFTT